MSINKRKEINLQKPVEKHYTASWSDVGKHKQTSQVSVPNETGVINAKEYVDGNEK